MICFSAFIKILLAFKHTAKIIFNFFSAPVLYYSLSVQNPLRKPYQPFAILHRCYGTLHKNGRSLPLCCVLFYRLLRRKKQQCGEFGEGLRCSLKGLRILLSVLTPFLLVLIRFVLELTGFPLARTTHAAVHTQAALALTGFPFVLTHLRLALTQVATVHTTFPVVLTPFP
jgi:hypothetical protein